MSKRIKSFEALNKLVTQRINKPDVINKSKKTSTQNSVLNNQYKYREVEGIPIYTEKEYQEEKRRNIEYSKTINRANRNKKEEQDKELREKRREEFEPIIKTYNINSLYHFTDLENLNSILDVGILTKIALERKGITYKEGDSHRYDYHSNCSCVSISYPNSYLLKNYRDEKPCSNIIILEIMPEIIYEHECIFAEYNAASAGIRESTEQKNDASAFQNMFADKVKVVTSTRGEETYHRKPSMRKNWPTTTQAEILIKGTIEQKFIRKVYFSSDIDIDKYRQKLEKNNIQMVVDDDIFTNTREQYYSIGW